GRRLALSSNTAPMVLKVMDLHLQLAQRTWLAGGWCETRVSPPATAPPTSETVARPDFPATLVVTRSIFRRRGRRNQGLPAPEAPQSPTELRSHGQGRRQVTAASARKASVSQEAVARTSCRISTASQMSA